MLKSFFGFGIPIPCQIAFVVKPRTMYIVFSVYYFNESFPTVMQSTGQFLQGSIYSKISFVNGNTRKLEGSEMLDQLEVDLYNLHRVSQNSPTQVERLFLLKMKLDLVDVHGPNVIS